MNLRNRAILITGGSAGIGLAGLPEKNRQTWAVLAARLT